MVYKLIVPDVKEYRVQIMGMCASAGVLAGGFTAVLLAVLGLVAGWVTGGALLAVGVASLLTYGVLMRGHRMMQGQGKWFVTVTEAGFMLEKPQEGTTMYQTWELVEKVRLKNGLLFVTLKNGLNYFLPLSSLSPGRAEELYAYCAKHAGKSVPEEKQVAPPEEMLAAPAFPCADAAAARQEVADELLLQRSPYIRWVYLVALAVMVLGLLVEVVVWGVTGEAEIEGLVVSLALSLFFLSRFLHPGAPMRKWVRYQSVSEAHIHQGKVLVHTPGVAWSMLPVSLVNGARTMNHAYVYTVRGGGVLGISRTVPPPADLPRPAPVKWWRNAMLLAVASFVAPALCLGLWYYCVPQSDSEAVDEVSERGDALAAYVQDLLPPGEFPGGISWCGVYGMEEGGSAVIIVWDSGLELTMEIPPVADASEADADSQL